jgi:hypothetical protein
MPTMSLIPAVATPVPHRGSAQNEYEVEHRRRGAILKYLVWVTGNYPKVVIW